MTKLDKDKIKEYLSQIENIYSPHILNLDKVNPKLILIFSGVPGSGKSTIAKIIESEFKAVRIRKDSIWELAIEPLYKNTLNLEDRNTILNKYLEFKYKKLVQGKNKFIIFDKSVDRKYDELKIAADKYNFPLFIVRLKVPREILEQRIKSRESSKESVQNYLKNMDRWIEENEKFNSEHNVDFSVNYESYDADLKKLLEILNKKV